jgi:hypothetical protein
MKVFVWKRIGGATDSWHPEGGLVVFAEDEGAARAMANAVAGCYVADVERPDDIRDVVGGEPAVYIFPDAGCC